MTILDRLVDELRAARGPIRSSELARRIGVSEPALSGMIGVLGAKGVLELPLDPTQGDAIACSGVACGTSCVGLEACPFIANVPDTYTLVASSTVDMPKRENSAPK